MCYRPRAFFATSPSAEGFKNCNVRAAGVRLVWRTRLAHFSLRVWHELPTKTCSTACATRFARGTSEGVDGLGVAVCVSRGAHLPRSAMGSTLAVSSPRDGRPESSEQRRAAGRLDEARQPAESRGAWRPARPIACDKVRPRGFSPRGWRVNTLPFRSRVSATRPRQSTAYPGREPNFRPMDTCHGGAYPFSSRANTETFAAPGPCYHPANVGHGVIGAPSACARYAVSTPFRSTP